jgi:hypothetical protein
MTRFTRSMIEVLERREQNARLALARVTRAVAATSAEIQAMDAVIAAVEARVKKNLEARLGGEPRTIAALLEQENQTQSLLSGCERVTELRRQAEHRLAELRVRQRAEARQWRRDEVKLMHVRAMARREAITQAHRVAESEDQAHAELLATVERNDESRRQHAF